MAKVLIINRLYGQRELLMPGEYLLFFGRIHIDKGAGEAIEIAKKSGMKLIMAGIIQDSQY